MLKNPSFEQIYWSRTAVGIYKKGHNCFRLMNWICYHDRTFYDNLNYIDMMGSVCKYLILNELSQR